MWRKPQPRANKLATTAGCTPALKGASNNASNNALNQGLLRITRAQTAINLIVFSLILQKHCALINWSLTPINLLINWSLTPINLMDRGVKKPHALLEHGAFGESASVDQAIKPACTLRCSIACVALDNEIRCNKRLRCTKVSNTNDADQRVSCTSFCEL